MGLCKCPKRRVTTQFCFEHHVNVCENCMITNHSKCVVQSYLQWLQDSDYSAGCKLCSSDMTSDDCIRLTCYHVYHWSCLQSMANSLPANVAPAGYRCPDCNAAIFPQPNLVSPVADILRGKLATVNWGRAGLGLPLLAETRDPPDGCKVTVDFDVDTKPPMNNSMMRNAAASKPVVHSADAVSEHSYNNFYGASQSRRSVSRPSPIGRHLDSDDDKYKRRSPAEMLSRVIRRAACVSPKMMKRQRWITAIVLIILFAFIILLMRELSLRVTDDDPAFNLENEPNIKVGDV